MKVHGNPVSASNPRPDWRQNDPNHAGYIENKPDIVELPPHTEADYDKVLALTPYGLAWVEQSASSSNGILKVADDGQGNVSITYHGIATITDDGNGNVVVKY